MKAYPDLAARLVALGFTPHVIDGDGGDFIVQDDRDGRGPYLASWLSTRPQPTATAIAAVALPDPLVGVLKAEASRRIEALYPIWRQLNLIREGGAELDAMSLAIDGIRARSNLIEAMDPIPPDFRDDRYWQSE